MQGFLKSGRQDLNLRPPGPQRQKPLLFEAFYLVSWAERLPQITAVWGSLATGLAPVSSIETALIRSGASRTFAPATA